MTTTGAWARMPGCKGTLDWFDRLGERGRELPPCSSFGGPLGKSLVRLHQERGFDYYQYFHFFFPLVNILLHLWGQCIIEQTLGYRDARFRECLVEILSAFFFPPSIVFLGYLCFFCMLLVDDLRRRDRGANTVQAGNRV
ncbi:hypothetical protein V8C26DRAFT_181668 [Trichoderma gracile]